MEAAVFTLMVNEVEKTPLGEAWIVHPFEVQHVDLCAVGDVMPEPTFVDALKDARVGKRISVEADRVESKTVPAIPVILLNVRVRTFELRNG